VINDSSTSFCELYIVDAGSDDWGENQLDSDETIDPGDEFTLSNIPYGGYDMRVVACDDEGEAERLSEEFDGPMEWTLTD
jgi:hypothetical protein